MARNSPKSLPPQRVDLDVMGAARRACEEYRHPDRPELKGIPAVAERMVVPVGTLYNKLHPSATDPMHHKLTVQDLVLIITVTGDPRPLQALAQIFSMVCIALPSMNAVSDEALLELLNKIGIEGGQFHSAFNNLLKGKRCTAELVATVHKEGHEYAAAIIEVMARVQGLIDA